MRRTATIALSTFAVVVAAACGLGGGPEPLTDGPADNGGDTTAAAADDAPAEGTRDNPYPQGATIALGDEWEVSLDGTNLDATDMVLSANQFNEVAEGYTPVTVDVTATYVGPESGQIWTSLGFSFVGGDGNAYDSSGENSYCGALDNTILDQGDQFPAATTTSLLCIAVPTDAIEGGVWRIEAYFDFDAGDTFVATT